MSSVRLNDRAKGRKDRIFVRAALTAIVAVALTASLGNTAGTAIRIGSAFDVGLGDTLRIPIFLDSVQAGRPIAALDLLIQFPSASLKLLDVQPGSLLSNCGWEYFNWRAGASPECTVAPCLNDKVRIIAMAYLFGPNTFSCHLTGPGTLATLSFLTGAHPDNIWGGGYLKFLWEDCGDNMLSLVGGDTVIVSDGVFLRGDKVDYALDSLPTFFGTPDACLLGGQGASIRRGVDYYDGEVKMTYISPVSDGAEISLSYNFTGPGLPVWVALKLGGIEPGQTISAFDLLVQFSSAAFSIYSVTMGDLLAAHSWEYFTYAVGSGAQCGGSPCSDGYVRIRGTADIANGIPNPGGQSASRGYWPKLYSTLH